jgi:hypothetical protein
VQVARTAIVDGRIRVADHLEDRACK